MIEVKIKAHDRANAETPSRLKAILLAAGMPVVVDDKPAIELTKPGTFAAEANHEGVTYGWVAA